MGPEEVTDPRHNQKMMLDPLSATEVVMDPPPRASTDRCCLSYSTQCTKFTLTFNEGVIAVTVNDTPASGSGLNWAWSAAACFTLWIM